jgi:hypothetical protein
MFYPEVMLLAVQGEDNQLCITDKHLFLLV